MTHYNKRGSDGSVRISEPHVRRRLLKVFSNGILQRDNP